eukprot:5855185-Prorocentrum_lima.AAC.1
MADMPAGFVNAARALPEREKEIVYLLELTEPYSEDPGVAQFIDVNKSLLYLLGKERNKQAFSTSVPT